MNWKSKKQILHLIQKNKKGDSKELMDYVDVVFKYYRKHGFPHFRLTMAEKNAILQHLRDIHPTSIWDGDVLRRNNYGYNLCNSYHLHMQSIQSHRGNNSICASPMDIFNDDEKLKKAIYKSITINKNADDGSIRCALKWANAKRVSNFRPTAAMAIYDRFLPGDGGVVYDPSMGYGGRILGAMSCKKVLKYIGTEPYTKTFMGLKNFVSEFNFQNRTQLIQDGSENSNKYIKNNSVDLVFTSPPYFNCEIYADDDSQSWVKYPDKKSWINGFAKDTMTNCKNMLKKNGYIIINIANVITYKDLEKDFVKMATEDVGLVLLDTLKLELASISVVSSGGKNMDMKWEPVFVFQKKGDKDWVKDTLSKKPKNVLKFFE